MEEIWKDIIGYEGLYQISNIGNVKSLAKEWYSGKSMGIKRSHPEMLLSQNISIYGYNYIRLSKNGKHKYGLVHRLMADAFIVNIDNKPFINHIDGNKLNNSLINLEWCTAQHNTIHAYRTGLMKAQHSEGHGHVKFSNYEMIELRKIVKSNLYKRKAIASLYGVSSTTIDNIYNDKTWKYLQ